MKAKSPSRLIGSQRCQYFTAAGRQCASLAGHRSVPATPRKTQPHQPIPLTFGRPSPAKPQSSRTHKGVNQSAGALYGLLSEGRISLRRASVLAYTSSLLLRTLPAIDLRQ
jgi:hypothetical protein